VPKSDLPTAQPVLGEITRAVGAPEVTTDPDVAKISLVGAGMKTHPGVAADMFDALAEAGINIEIISTSTIRISCLIRAGDVERAVKVVHDRFRLAEPGVLEEAYGNR
jgi:aspartate kinase